MKVSLWLALMLMPLGVRAETVGYPLVSSYSGTETGLHSISFGTWQDNEGILYFASTALLTFDGDRWKSVRIPQSYAIRSLNFGADGRLWAGAMGDLGWFERIPGSDWVFRSLRDKLPEGDSDIGDVWAVVPDQDGTTFVSTTHILRWDGKRFVRWKKSAGGKLFPSLSNGRLFVHEVEKGLFEVDALGPRLVMSREILGDSAVVWVECRPEGWLLGRSAGFLRYDGKAVTPYAPAIDKFLDAGRLSSACRLPDGRLAVGTVRGGIAFLRADGTLESILSDPDAIPSSHITSLFVGREGDLWATTGSHILKIDLAAHSTIFDTRAGLPRQTYRKITKAHGSIFAANESGVYELAAGSNRFASMPTLPGRWKDLQGTERGLLLSGFQTAMLWERQATTPLYRTEYDVSTTIPTRGNSGDLLLADYRRIIRLSRDGGRRTIVEQVPDTPLSIAEDLEGRLWIGTLARGMFVAQPDAKRSVEAKPTVNSFDLPSLVGPTHVRTNAAGVVMIFADNGAWHKTASSDRFVPVNDFPLRSIAAVSELATDGTVWVAHENSETLAPCVGRISLRGPTATWEPHAVDGLVEVGAPRSLYADHINPDTTVLWIGGTHALLRHVVGRELSVSIPRPPLLRAFARIAGTETRTSILDVVPYSTELLEFEFAAPEFSRRSLLRIETQIEGVDPGWTALDTGSRRELTAIREGNYTVKARVVAETGAVSDETEISFKVLPPWWRTAPGVAMGVIVAAVLGFAAYQVRVRTLRRRNAQLEAKIRERTDQLERANAAKTQFVANMSHDIRNPLNGIVGLALALEDTRLDQRQQELVATLGECTTYLSSLVDDVLDFASIEAGRVELRPRAFRPHELLRSIVETLKGDATASGAVITVESGPDVPKNVFGDAGRIQQILVNFVSNSLKYAGGNIRLSAVAHPYLPDEIEFAVTDEGPGISPEDQGSLFTKFSRLRREPGGEEIPGTGLGLAACRLLADIMGGSVGVESRAGEGARFFLRLPLVIATEAEAIPATRLPNTTVLLVEDTDYNAWAATAVLAKLGLSCERARTGAEALRLFSEKRFNVVLLDRNLPDIDGTEVARRIREMESDGRRAVLLAVTAYCTAGDRALCLDAGMDAFVGKPLTPEKLRKVLLETSRRLLTSMSVQVTAESPPPETAPAEPDVSLLTYLSDGSPEGLELQIRRFVATLHEAERGLHAALECRDFTALGLSAHQLLGQARMVGSDSLGQAATQLETAARSTDVAACTEQLKCVRQEVELLTATMRRRHSDVQLA